GTAHHRDSPSPRRSWLMVAKATAIDCLRLICCQSRSITGAAINNSANRNKGQLKETGSTARNALGPLAAARIASAMNTYTAIAAPAKFAANTRQSCPEPPFESSD